MLTARPEGYGWVGQQCVIIFLVLLVLTPGLTDTMNRAVARMIGTMCEAIAVSFLLAHVLDQGSLLQIESFG